jgi:hypothetical protein
MSNDKYNIDSVIQIYHNHDNIIYKSFQIIQNFYEIDQ